jgi:serine O-acetyltransferase
VSLGERGRRGGVDELNSDRLYRLKGRLRRLWVSPERLWLTANSLSEREHWLLAFCLKQLNSFLYHNSLAPGASISPDIFLGHNSMGIVISPNVEIGKRVTIWHNVTLTAGRAAKRAAKGAPSSGADGLGRAGAGAEQGPRSRIIIEDGVTIGANVVVIAPRASTLRIGKGARIGAGTVLTSDVPAGSTVVGASPRVIPSSPRGAGSDAEAPAPEQFEQP